jgi:hypothetical protein
VGLSEPGIPVYEEWIVNLPWCLAYSMSGGGRELIRFTDYEKVKRVSLA